LRLQEAKAVKAAGTIAWFRIVALSTLWIIGGSLLKSRAAEPFAADLVIKGGTIVDGTGSPPRKGDVAIRGDRIVAVGDCPIDSGTRVIDASGRIVAPGFIDLHTHSDETILKPNTRLNLNYLTQGVTTIVTGNCGAGPIDALKYLAAIDSRGAGTNVAHLVPHGSLRSTVMGMADRKATGLELERMKTLLERALDDGAWGMATGLIYLPGRYADTAELIELSRVVAARGGLYASHIRSEEDGLLEAIDEALAIGREANLPVHISHLKANGKTNWGKAGLAIERIEKARRAGRRVTADQYPYVASSTRLAAMVVPHWAVRSGPAEFARLAASPQTGQNLRTEIARELDRRDGGAMVRIARFAPRPDWVGRNLQAIAGAEGTTPLEIVLEIEKQGGAQAINFGMSEPDVRAIMKLDFVATASDGSAHHPGGADRPHPRAYGTFPRKLRYALDEQVISLEQAIRSCTGLPAEILGLPERGVLRAGNFADVVVFDPRTFRDASTFDEPTRYASGIAHLFVNGVAVIADGKPAFRALPDVKLPGRALRHATDGPASVILRCGRIWSGDREKPWAEAIAIRGSQVAAVGSRADLERFKGPKTMVFDRPHAFAMPGLIDAHGHVESLGASLEELDLRGVASLEEIARRVRAKVEAEPGEGWIIGSNWDQSLWPGGRFPTAAILDAVAAKRPVWLRRVDGHAGWASTEAMRRAGIHRDTKAPADGQILRDSRGEPTGVFIDGAMGLIGKVISSPTRSVIRRHILAAQEAILATGLTGVHDAGVSSLEAEVYRELEREGQLRLRVYGMASPPGGGEEKFVSHPPRKAPADARFELRAIKLFIDGAMGSRGGLLFEPYHDDPGNNGLQLIASDVLVATTTMALRNGWQVATHAIGDRGNALVLDAYEQALRAVPRARDARLRVEHAQLVRKEDVGRFAALGIVASMQPSHASDDLRWAEARVGADRVKGAYAWRWFLDANVRMAFGSDFPVEVVNPFWGLYAGITRQEANGQPAGGWHPEHLMTLEETLRGYTAGAAYAAFAEDRLGVLRPGMQADITVVDRDPFASSPADLLRSKALMTLIGGEVVYERPDR
jgi:predicted amidohydrolase YtcJ